MGKSEARRVGWLVACIIVVVGSPALTSAAEVFFSPEGGARAKLVQTIRQSRLSIDVAVYHLTSFDLADALVDAQARNVRVRLITDREKLQDPTRAIQILRRSGIPIRALGVPSVSLMHNKFAIFDDRLVATGSYNWTNPAERVNYENLVIFNEPDTVARFTREFTKLWREAKE